jgi:hypothetical protein
MISSCQGKDVDGRDISAFTRVFRRATPGHDGGGTAVRLFRFVGVEERAHIGDLARR